MTSFASYLNFAMQWALFLAMFPMAFFWLRRGWRIIVKRDFSEVALKRGEPPPNAEKYAPFTAATNLICGMVMVATIFGVLIGRLDYDWMLAIVGVTVWCKIFIDFSVSRHARLFKPKDGKAAKK